MGESQNGQMTNSERKAMDMLLAGDLPELKILELQYRSAKITERKSTGVGFFVHFEVPASIPRISNSNFTLGDVSGSSGDKSCGFILFVRGGALSMLECHTYVGDLPLDPNIEKMWYDIPPASPKEKGYPSNHRDVQSLVKIFAKESLTLNIADLLDRHMDEADTVAWLSKLGSSKKEEFSDHNILACVRHHFHSAGLSVEFSRYASKTMALSCLTIYILPVDGFKAFTGESSPNLKGYKSREVVRKELGTPSRSGSEFGTAGRTWDSFDRDKYFFGFAYDTDFKVIKVTFQSRGYYKND